MRGKGHTDEYELLGSSRTRELKRGKSPTISFERMSGNVYKGSSLSRPLAGSGQSGRSGSRNFESGSYAKNFMRDVLSTQNHFADLNTPRKHYPAPNLSTKPFGMVPESPQAGLKENKTPKGDPGLRDSDLLMARIRLSSEPAEQRVSGPGAFPTDISGTIEPNSNLVSSGRVPVNGNMDTFFKHFMDYLREKDDKINELQKKVQELAESQQRSQTSDSKLSQQPLSPRQPTFAQPPASVHPTYPPQTQYQEPLQVQIRPPSRYPIEPPVRLSARDEQVSRAFVERVYDPPMLNIVPDQLPQPQGSPRNFQNPYQPVRQELRPWSANRSETRITPPIVPDTISYTVHHHVPGPTLTSPHQPLYQHIAQPSYQPYRPAPPVQIPPHSQHTIHYPPPTQTSYQYQPAPVEKIPQGPPSFREEYYLEPPVAVPQPVSYKPDPSRDQSNPFVTNIEESEFRSAKFGPESAGNLIPFSKLTFKELTEDDAEAFGRPCPTSAEEYGDNYNLRDLHSLESIREETIHTVVEREGVKREEGFRKIKIYVQK